MSDTFLFNGRPVPFTPGQTILQAALAAGDYVPHLCFHPDFPPHGSCRVCTVRVNGRPASSTPATATRGASLFALAMWQRLH